MTEKQTTISIKKETAIKIKPLAKKQSRSTSAQIDFIINQYLQNKEMKK